MSRLVWKNPKAREELKERIMRHLEDTAETVFEGMLENTSEDEDLPDFRDNIFDYLDPDDLASDAADYLTAVYNNTLDRENVEIVSMKDFKDVDNFSKRVCNRTSGCLGVGCPFFDMECFVEDEFKQAFDKMKEENPDYKVVLTGEEK